MESTAKSSTKQSSAAHESAPHFATAHQDTVSEARATHVHPKVGLLAGWGDYPLIVARALAEQGYEIHCLGVREHADPRLAETCHHFAWIGLAQLGGAIRFFRQHGVKRVTMAGKIHKVKLYQPWIWWHHLPDWRAVRRFYRHFLLSQKDRKDDTLLKAVIDEFALDGISFAPATDFVPELLVKVGQLTRAVPSRAQQRDIEFAWSIAKEIGRMDIGQSVAVKDRAVLAVEAIEGTDECIRRAGQLCRSGNFTLVKVAKPQQDMRFDVPTIGLGTLRTMVEAGRVLAIAADRTIMLDQERLIDYADRHRLAIVALQRPTLLRTDSAHAG